MTIRTPTINVLESIYWQNFARGDFAALKHEIVNGDKSKYSFGRIENINEHIKFLIDEFVGRSYLELFHSIVIVKIRRKLDAGASIEIFNSLWKREGPFLKEKLDTRWLISACDTIVDTSEDKIDVAAAYAGSLFMNTIKLYETELLASGTGSASHDEAPPYKPIEGRTPLFDGMSAFVIGHGDMIANLYDRAKVICRGETPAQIILAELLKRANENDTVFRRFRDVHQNRNTIWHAPDVNSD